MPELEVELVDGDELKFDQSFLQFNVKKRNVYEAFKKNILKEHSRFDWKCWILDTASLKS